MQKLGRHSLIALTVTYGVTFLLWRLLVWSPAGHSWAWLQVSEVFGLIAYLPALLLLPGAIALRNRWAWLGLLVQLIWFGAQYGKLFLPNAALPAQSGTVANLRVMTWNTG